MFQLKKAGIHPVAGLTIELELAEGQTLPLVLYAQSSAGYKNLLKISSSIAIRPQQSMPLHWLLAYCEGIAIILLPFDKQQAWLQLQAQAILQALVEAKKENLYVGIARQHGVHPFEAQAIELAQNYGLQVVAMHESDYMYEQDAFAYQVAQAIESGIKLNEQQYESQQNGYVLTAQQWLERFKDQPQWLENTERLLASCQVDIHLNEVYMPKFPLNPGENAAQVLQQQVLAGLQKRLNTNVLPAHYLQRMNYELQIIQSMGYADYF